MTEVKIQEFTVMVDDEDAERIQEHKWYMQRDKLKKQGTHYFTDRASIKLHRFLMGCNKGDGRYVDHIDHIDHNGLNLQKSNLRICTNTENCRNQRLSNANTSGFKGVHWAKRDKKWHAQIAVDKKKLHLGYYSVPEEAAKVYDIASIAFHGEFGLTNFDKSTYKDMDCKAEINKILDRHKRSSVYRGVSFYTAYSKWKVDISRNKKRVHVGYFTDELEAARAYDKKATEILGKAARLNFPAMRALLS